MVDQFERFWEMYPRKVAKGAARKVWAKIVKGMETEDCEKFTESLWRALDSQKRHNEKLKKSGDFAPGWKHPATWLNGECWLDDVEDRQEKTERIKLSKCSTPGCEDEVMGANYDVCAVHFSRSHDKYREEKRDFMTRHELLPAQGEPVQDYAQRCKEKCIKMLPNVR